MEKYIWVIWLVMIVLGGLLNNRKKGQAKEIDEDSASEEMRQDAPTEQRPHVLSPQEQLKAKIEALRAAQQRKAAQIAHKQSQKAAAPQPKPQAKATAKIKPNVAPRLKSETEEQHELLRDFSVDKAVLYSEIMKPKYLDYE
ncbi:MAG: hypothetical protein Q4A18_06995 [Rikenellaceae bacterium]|nr:hypothetical protein [Rikenellaceae bacterium]